MYEAAYGELTPLGGSIYADKIEKVDEKEILKFAYKHFVTGNVVISASGIPHERLKDISEAMLAEFQTGDSTKITSPYIGGEVRIRKDINDLSYLGLAFPVTKTNGK